MEMRSIRVAFMTGTVALFHTASVAQQPVVPETYLTADRMLSDIKSGSDLARIILHSYGFQTGFINAKLKYQGLPQLYCSPEKLAITSEQHADILKRYVENHEGVGQFPAGAVLVDALEETFPCKTSDE
ncbi:Rap1a/Tai family immunity protein [Parasphingorhabdus flavimaris]|uniref:Rap1a/Tai family immunity protein n=1 Tax=Parasphingorhabdus flavimaris TaxID=266812 RepID=UPI0030011082